jgi:hypothetical protein
MAQQAVGGHVKLLSGFGAKHAKEMRRVRPNQKSAVAFNPVGNPAAAGHVRARIT